MRLWIDRFEQRFKARWKVVIAASPYEWGDWEVLWIVALLFAVYLVSHPPLVVISILPLALDKE